MKANPDLAALASLIADPSRAAMLLALMDDVSLPAGELARHAGVTPQTASFHLSILVQGNLVTMTRSGRYRYFRLSGKRVAEALETLALIAPPSRPKTLKETLAKKALHRARTCYDHLAGELGVAVTQALVNQGIIQHHGEIYDVTASGEDWFKAFGIDCHVLREKRRLFARACLDWSERKPHIAGALGSAIAGRLFELKWITRSHGTRMVKVTETGTRDFKTYLGLDWK